MFTVYAQYIVVLYTIIIQSINVKSSNIKKKFLKTYNAPSDIPLCVTYVAIYAFWFWKVIVM